MIEISHIVVNGCSLTYCQGLDKPHIDGWPALLANKLQVPVINLAVGGAGNDSIHRRTFEYFYKNKELPGKPLYIIAFSDATRREEFFIEYKGKKHEDFHGLALPSSDQELVSGLSNHNHELYEIAHVLNMSLEAYERKKFIYWNSLANLFQNHNIPYITADYMPTTSTPVQEYMKQNYNEIFIDALEDKAYIGKLSEITKNIPKLPCNHEKKETMPIISQYFYDKILEVYGEIKPMHISEKYFLTLKEFYSKKQQQFMNYNTWIQNS